MSSASTAIKTATAALELVFLTAVIWVLRGYVWPTLSPVEVTVLQARLDPSLFPGDALVQEALRFTPRFYFNELILLLAHAGLSLAWAFAAWHLVALAALISGLRALARTLGAGNAVAAMLVVWVLVVGVGMLGGVFFFTPAPVPAVWADAVVVWGAVFAVRQRWTAAYACFGAAALLQFLVGFYAGVLALPALWQANRRNKLSALGLWALGLALIYGPIWFNGTTGAGELDNATFVEIYAQLRHPHHLIPSTWGWPVWVQAGVFYAGAWWFLRKTARDRPAFEQTLLHATLALTAAALAVNFVFVEIQPLAWIAKLQPARITPLAQVVVLTLLALRLQALVARKDWLGATLLALIPLSPFPGFLLLLLAILWTPSNARLSMRHFILVAAVLLAFQPFDASLAARGPHYGLWLAIFGFQLVPGWLAHRPLPLALAAGLAVAGAGWCANASLGPSWPHFLVQPFAIDAPPFDVIGLLGRRFERYAPKDACVLVPPISEAWSFKLFARRSVVVDIKNIPFTDRGMAEWKKRMDDVLGTPWTRGLDAEGAWAAQPSARLVAVARRHGAGYVLTRDAWHSQLPGTVVDRLQGWTLWRLTTPQ